MRIEPLICQLRAWKRELEAQAVTAETGFLRSLCERRATALQIAIATMSPGVVMTLDETRDASLDDLRADIIRSAAQGQGPTFIAAKLDMLIERAKQRERHEQSQAKSDAKRP